MADKDALIRDLKASDYYLRSTAARMLGEIGGEDAVAALIGALGDEDDWVKEYAAEALGKLAAGAAVEPLGELLKSDNYKVRTCAVEALGKIGGDRVRAMLEPLKDDHDSWVRTAVIGVLDRLPAEGAATRSAKPASATTAQRPPKRDTEPGLAVSEAVVEPKRQSTRTHPSFSDQMIRTPDEIVKEITTGTSIKYKKTSSGFILRVSVGGGRYQKVRLNFGSVDEDGAPIIQLFTVIGPAMEKHYRWALTLNPTFSYGAIGIVKIDGKDFLTIIDTVLEENLNEIALEKSLLTLARMGDALEKKLIQKDLW